MNPFTYDRPVGPADLIDREEEVRHLVALAEGGHATRLSAPRRYGKTSLLGRVLLEVERLGMNTVMVDFFGVVSTADVADRIEEAYRRRLQGPARRTAANLLRAMTPSVRAGFPGVGVSVALTGEADARRRLGRLLDLPLTVLERTGRRTLVAFDEVQALLAAGDQIDGLVRSHIQHHGDAAAYVFAGSEPSLMRELFETRERPLYGQARPVTLGPLPDGEVADFIATRFEGSGKEVAPEVLEALLDLAQGHPQRAMLLAHHVFERTAAAQVADEQVWAAASDAALTELEESFEVQWRALSRPERAVLSELASGQTDLLAASVIGRLGIGKSTLVKARDRLTARGIHLRRATDTLVFVDPLFAAWIRAQRRAA